MPLNHNKYSELTLNQFNIIGKVIVEFSNIEFLLGIILSRMLLTPDYLGRTYMDRMNFTDRCEAIKNALDIHQKRYAYKIISEVQVTSIKSILNDISKLRPYRNYFSHYCWMRVDDKNIAGTSFPGKLPCREQQDKYFINLSFTNIEKIYSSAYKIVENLIILIEDLPEFEESIELAKKHILAESTYL